MPVAGGDSVASSKSFYYRYLINHLFILKIKGCWSPGKSVSQKPGVQSDPIYSYVCPGRWHRKKLIGFEVWENDMLYKEQRIPQFHSFSKGFYKLDKGSVLKALFSHTPFLTHRETAILFIFLKIFYYFEKVWRSKRKWMKYVLFENK